MDSANRQWQPNRGLPYFFNHYGKSIVVSAALVIGSLYAGYRWWLHQRALQAQMAVAYVQLLPHFSPKGADERQDGQQSQKVPATEGLAANTVKQQATQQIEQFIQQNRQHIYGVLAAMQWAKHYVDHQEYEQAVKQLTVALSYDSDANVQALLRLRLARLQWQLEQPAAALATLSKLKKQQAWWSHAQTIRGDILQQQNDLQEASAAYQKALEANTGLVLSPHVQQLQQQQELIKMRLNDVVSSTKRSS